MKSFIVELWCSVFGVLRWVSLFEPLRRIFPKLKTHGAVDVWVFSNLVLATVAAIAAPYSSSSWCMTLLVGYGLIRTFEITVYQVNVLLFDEYRARKAGRQYALRGYRRVVILMLQNYIEIIFWFAAIYIWLNLYFVFRVPGSEITFFGGLYSSFITMTTFGDPNLVPKNLWAAGLILFQSATGLFMTLLSLARFISLIPSPESSDKFDSPKCPKCSPRRRTNQRALRRMCEN